MSALGELLQAHFLEGLSPLVGGCEQEYNLAVLCHPLKTLPCTAQSEHILPFPSGSTCDFSQQIHF